MAEIRAYMDGLQLLKGGKGKATVYFENCRWATRKEQANNRTYSAKARTR